MQEEICSIYYVNAESIEKIFLVAPSWIFTETQTKQESLDTHCSYGKLMLELDLKDENSLTL